MAISGLLSSPNNLLSFLSTCFSLSIFPSPSVCFLVHMTIQPIITIGYWGSDSKCVLKYLQKSKTSSILGNRRVPFNVSWISCKEISRYFAFAKVVSRTFRLEKKIELYFVHILDSCFIFLISMFLCSINSGNPFEYDEKSISSGTEISYRWDRQKWAL